MMDIVIDKVSFQTGKFVNGSGGFTSCNHPYESEYVEYPIDSNIVGFYIQAYNDGIGNTNVYAFWDENKTYMSLGQRTRQISDGVINIPVVNDVACNSILRASSFIAGGTESGVHLKIIAVLSTGEEFDITEGYPSNGSSTGGGSTEGGGSESGGDSGSSSGGSGEGNGSESGGSSTGGGSGTDNGGSSTTDPGSGSGSGSGGGSTEGGSGSEGNGENDNSSSLVPTESFEGKASSTGIFLDVDSLKFLLRNLPNTSRNITVTIERPDPICGKTFLFLGDSIAEGAGTGGYSKYTDYSEGKMYALSNNNGYNAWAGTFAGGAFEAACPARILYENYSSFTGENAVKVYNYAIRSASIAKKQYSKAAEDYLVRPFSKESGVVCCPYGIDSYRLNGEESKTVGDNPISNCLYTQAEFFIKHMGNIFNGPDNVHNTGIEKQYIQKGYVAKHPDVIIIEGGTNDIFAMLGSMEDNYENSVENGNDYEIIPCLEKLFYLLHSTFNTPTTNTTFIYYTTFPSSFTGFSANTYISVHNAIKNVCKKWGVLYYDMAAEIPNVFMFNPDNNWHGINVHPLNKTNRELIYPKLASYLRRVLCEKYVSVTG